MKLAWIGLSVAFVSISPSPVSAQGRTDYFNVESPQVKPIAVARVSGHDYILACNTPDNSLEVWDTDETLAVPNRFRGRVRVGLEPVSVKFNSGLAYTTNFLGDSISIVDLAPLGSGGAPKLLTTRNVGDEPMDIAFFTDGSLLVTHNTPGSFGRRDATTLDSISGMDLVPLVVGTKGIKEPRSVALSGSTMYVLGFKGGNTAGYDFDVYLWGLGTPPPQSIGGLGSTNFNMTFASNGDLWVVGAEAQNNALGNDTEAGVANDPTGFVKSMLYLVRGGSTSGTISRRDLNQDLTGQPVSNANALAQPTDVLAYQPMIGPRKIVVTALGSDRVAFVTPSSPPGNPLSWPITRINVSPVGASDRAGPRGLAVRYAISGAQDDPGDRVYVLNRLDNSISILDPQALVLKGTFLLKSDPTPPHIKQGRKFLYSAEFSGNKFVSCASCHMDGRTDSLLWKLGDLNPANPYPAGFAEGLPAPKNFEANKGGMVTQTLQGLLNFEVDPAIQDFFTNAPYHWRGDKTDFLGFNAAFVGLMGAPNIGGNPPKGISDAGMERFRTFINSISYPPNPYQPTTRQFSGAIGDLEDDAQLDIDNGSEAMRGLKLFHVLPIEEICDGRSCVQCHFLPEGSNNRATDPSGALNDLIETAATRGLFQREARMDSAAGVLSDIVTSETGLTHFGFPAGTATLSLNAFVQRFNNETGFDAGRLLALKHFMRQFDFGVAPLVGSSRTVTAPPDPLGDPNSAIASFEAQAAVANVGLAVQGRIAGQDRGWWYDLTEVPAAKYRSEDDLTTLLTRAQLLALLSAPDDRLTFVATPLGSERRVASASGATTPLSGAPFGVELRPAVTNTAYAAVPSLKKNWAIQTAGDPPGPDYFAWNGAASLAPLSVKAIRIMQYGLRNAGFGLTELRHEAPRRFVVAGWNIKQGAFLHLYVPDTNQQPNLASPPEGNIPTVLFKLPLYPTGQTLADGRRVWQTAVEIDPYWLYVLMLGGRNARGMSNIKSPSILLNMSEPPASNPFAPQLFNYHYVRVRNPDGQTSHDGWQRLTVQ